MTCFAIPLGSGRVTSQPRRGRAPAAAKAVFINCPFDDRYKPILRAMLFAIIASGYHPRCGLDKSDGAEIRANKLAQMIRECDWGIHDLSRVEVTNGLPRFNMAMELGLHLGARLFGKGRHRGKRALILDAEPNRYDATLSDISGQDIEVHGNEPTEAMRCVRNWLSDNRKPNSPPLPGASAMQSDYRQFQAEIPERLKRLRLSEPELTHNDFVWAVYDWIDTRALKKVKATDGLRRALDQADMPLPLKTARD
jgi:hypothetical protein